MNVRADYHRQYYKANKHSIDLRNTKYRKDNKDKLRDHYKKNRKMILEKSKQYQKDNKDRVNKYHRQYLKDNPDKAKEGQLKYKYGISLIQYEELLEKQKEQCAICCRHISKLDKSLNVDHNHKTGNIRGLLCSKCNIGLGNFNDDSALLIKAADYLRQN